MKRESIIAYLAEHRRVTARETANAVGCSVPWAKKVLGRECYKSDQLGYYADEKAWVKRVLEFVENNQ